MGKLPGLDTAILEAALENVCVIVAHGKKKEAWEAVTLYVHNRMHNFPDVVDALKTSKVHELYTALYKQDLEAQEDGVEYWTRRLMRRRRQASRTSP